MNFSKRTVSCGLIGCVLFVAGWMLQTPATAEPRHGMSMHDTLDYPADFTHFDYVNPDAPKGGKLALATLGSFDSLNPFIVRGSGLLSLRVTNLVFERLMARSFSEPFALYGLIAEYVDLAPDRTSVTFTLNPNARFSDGEPLTVDDVIFSFEALRDEGRPNYRSYYRKVTGISRSGDHQVTFHLGNGEDRELPLILGLMPILPEHVYGNGVFERATLDLPVGSGPYTITAVEAGSTVTFTRDPDWWGADLPVNRGQYNFDERVIEYFRDENTMFEAFKRGLYDYRPETDPTRWATGYDFPAARDGDVITDEIATALPKGMLGLVFNTRRPMFADVRVRQALTYLFDFEWINKNLYFGLLGRTQSYFEGSDLSFAGAEADDAERAILGDAAQSLPQPVLDGSFQQPVTDGTGRNRRNLRTALTLLEEAGYTLSGGTMTNVATGAPFTFEILVVSREQERLALSFGQSLKRAGIEISVRQTDAAQFQQRRQTFDFDMIQNRWYFSLSPGNEQSFYWSAEAAETEGTRNYMGVADPAVDRAVDQLVVARTRDDLVAAARALDRLLIAGHYVIPLFHTPKQWTARWTHIQRPETLSLWGSQPETWWSTRPQ